MESPPAGALNTGWYKNFAIFTNKSLYLASDGELETTPKVSNGTSFNDLE